MARWPLSPWLRRLLCAGSVPQAVTGGAGTDRLGRSRRRRRASPSRPMRSAGATWYGPGLLRQPDRLRPDPAAGDDRRRPSQPPLRHRGQVHLPRPRGPRPRHRSWALRRRASPGTSPTAPAKRSDSKARAGSVTRSSMPVRALRRPWPFRRCYGRPVASLPPVLTIYDERSKGMSRVYARSGSMQGRLGIAAAGAGHGDPRLRLPGALGALFDGSAGAAKTSKTTVVLGGNRGHARPLLPGAALPGDRQRHRLPGQQRPGPACPSASRATARSSPGR